MDAGTRRALFALQLELECTHIEDGHILVPFPCANPDPPARVVVADFGEQCEAFVHDDVPQPIRARVLALDARECFAHPATIAEVLDGTEPHLTRFRAYVFPNPVTLGDDSPASLLPTPNELGFASYGVTVADTIVSACSSVREDDRSGEAWVFTDEAYQRRGYARQTVLAWSKHLQSAGKTPFYSHLEENAASRALAESLGLVPFVDAVAIE